VITRRSSRRIVRFPRASWGNSCGWRADQDMKRSATINLRGSLRPSAFAATPATPEDRQSTTHQAAHPCVRQLQQPGLLRRPNNGKAIRPSQQLGNSGMKARAIRQPCPDLVALSPDRRRPAPAPQLRLIVPLQQGAAAATPAALAVPGALSLPRSRSPRPDALGPTLHLSSP
jgi:hypothetical protein